LSFTTEWYNLAEKTLDTSIKHGFNDADDGTAIALIHAELSEALEEVRLKEGRRSDKIPAFWAIEEELADAVIRIMNYAQSGGLRLPEAIEAKALYNTTRQYKHGKRF
jgi:NTP pyrophosphatase (non-canonical NTP hydrolase)